MFASIGALLLGNPIARWAMLAGIAAAIVLIFLWRFQAIVRRQTLSDAHLKAVTEGLKNAATFIRKDTEVRRLPLDERRRRLRNAFGSTA